MLEDVGMVVIFFMIAFFAVMAVPGLRSLALMLSDIISFVSICALVGMYATGALGFTDIVREAGSGFRGSLIPVLGSIVIMAACALLCGQDGINPEELRLMLGTAVTNSAVIVHYGMHITVMTEAGNLNPSVGARFFILFSLGLLITVGALLWFGTQPARAWHASRGQHHESPHDADHHEEVGGHGHAAPAANRKPWLAAGAILLIFFFAWFFRAEISRGWRDLQTEVRATDRREGDQAPPSRPETKTQSQVDCDCVKSFGTVITDSGSYRRAVCGNGKKFPAKNVLAVPRCQ